MIYATIKGFGTAGPSSSYKSFDMLAQAAGGAVSAAGLPDSQPVNPGSTSGETGTGLPCAIGTLSASIERRETGQGQTGEGAVQDAVINCSRGAMPGYSLTGKPVKRQGKRMLGMAPGDIHPCAPEGPNDYVYVTASSEHLWESLPRVIDRVELIGDERCFSPAARSKNAEEGHALTANWTRSQDKFGAMKLIGEAEVLCGAVLDTGDILVNEHLKKPGLITTVEHPQPGGFYPAGLRHSALGLADLGSISPAARTAQRGGIWRAA